MKTQVMEIESNKELPESERDLIDSVGNERYIPDFSDLKWIASLDKREIEEIRLACFYAQSPHGTVGHNRLLLITKLADRLSTIEDLINAEAFEEFPQMHRIYSALTTGQG